MRTLHRKEKIREMSTEILIINPRALNPWGKDAATGTQVISETIRKKKQ